MTRTTAATTPLLEYDWLNKEKKCVAPALRV